jgi:hypothetical protein
MSSSDTPQPGKLQTGKPQQASYAFLAVIFIAVLIDAFLFAQVHANYVHDHGFDVRPRHPAVAKPAPP